MKSDNNFKQSKHKIKRFQILRIGEAQFKIQQGQSQEKNFFLESIDKAKMNLSNKCWKLNDRVYNNQNWNILFDKMVISFAQILNLAGNHRQCIIKQIQYPKFQKIINLNICNCRQNKAYNNITNIETLTLIQFPTLKKLLFSNNLITRINSLKKGVFKQILAIHLGCNFLNQVSLSQTQLNLNTKVLTFQVCSNDKILIQDVSFLVKLQPKSLQQVWVNNNSRLKQDKIHQMFSKKQIKKQEQLHQPLLILN